MRLVETNVQAVKMTDFNERLKGTCVRKYLKHTKRREGKEKLLFIAQSSCVPVYPHATRTLVLTRFCDFGLFLP